MRYGRNYGWRPYVPVAKRRRQAEKVLQKLQKSGHPVAPIVIEGRTIAKTFWGKAWCENLERYSDYSNRLPRGRTYVRNGSVVDLQIAPGEVSALVSGSEIYHVAIKISAVAKPAWASICADCSGAIDSLVELLQGRFSKGVMERICRQQTGLFPAPAEIRFSCTCPDWASMCKHVAAVFYGIGARLDEKPELLFKLREVDEVELIAKAGKGLPLGKSGPASTKVLAEGDLSELFGLELDQAAPEVAPQPKPAKPARAPKQTKMRDAAKAQPLPKTKVPKKSTVRKASAASAKKKPTAGVKRKVGGKKTKKK